GGMTRLPAQKKLAWNCSKPADYPSHQPVRFSSGSDNAYDACEIDGCCSSTAVQCNKTFGNMDNRRSSCSSCGGNTHIPGIRSLDIRSHNDIPDNRSRLRLLRCRLKPERQLVLLEPEPVRSLPME